jgi:hypothetical protein
MHVLHKRGGKIIAGRPVTAQWNIMTVYLSLPLMSVQWKTMSVNAVQEVPTPGYLAFLLAMTVMRQE